MEAVLTALPPQTIHHVSESSGIAAVRRAGNQLASCLGLDETVAGKVALVITEAATNIFKHAGSGDILLRGLAAGDARGVEVLAIDKGPGFVNIEQAMRDGMSTAGSRATAFALGSLPPAALMMINKAVGFRLMRGVSEKTLAGLGRGVPFAGGFVGGGIDGFMMKKIADHAMKEFPAVS